MIPFKVLKKIMKALPDFEMADASYNEVEPQTCSNSYFSVGKEGKSVRSVLLRKQTGESLVLSWDGVKNQIWVVEPILIDIDRKDGDNSYNNASSDWTLIKKETPTSEIFAKINFWSLAESAREKEEAANRPLESDEYFYTNACIDGIFG